LFGIVPQDTAVKQKWQSALPADLFTTSSCGCYDHLRRGVDVGAKHISRFGRLYIAAQGGSSTCR